MRTGVVCVRFGSMAPPVTCGRCQATCGAGEFEELDVSSKTHGWAFSFAVCWACGEILRGDQSERESLIGRVRVAVDSVLALVRPTTKENDHDQH
jgi:uncharacterized ParB-like nuclease family protein